MRLVVQIPRDTALQTMLNVVAKNVVRVMKRAVREPPALLKAVYVVLLTLLASVLIPLAVVLMAVAHKAQIV